MLEKFFFGAENLIPFTGIVERRNNDDLRIGRCKVRAFGHHTADTSILPTESLPDAFPLEPLSGVFWSTAREGDTVFGYFLDDKKQLMLIVGKLPAAIQNEINHPDGNGFRDARTDEELVSFPRQRIPTGGYVYSPSGITIKESDAAYRYPPHGPGKSSIPFLARAIEKNIPNQISPNTKKAQASGTRYNTADGLTWFERPSEWNAVYPFNHVYESESLHSIEFDDTPGSERVSLHHRLGSGFEFFPDGSIVYKNVKDGYEVVLGNKNVGISGSCDIHIKGKHTLLVDGDMIQHISGDYFLSVDGDMKVLIRGQEIKNIGGDSLRQVEGDIVDSASGTLYIKGSPIQENSSSTPDVPEVHDFDLPDLPENSITNTDKLIATTGTSFAAKDDKDESSQADMVGEIQTTNQKIPDIIQCPLVSNSTENFTNGDVRYRMQLSKYFQLGDVTIRTTYPHHMVSQGGMNQDELVCNLASLCQNIVDPIFQKFPGARINSGFRSFTNGKSQHEVGEAVDLQWPSIGLGSLNKYIEISNWIKENLPFDQLILEHGSTCWIHVSMSRKKQNRKQVFTMKDGLFTPGLDLFGRS